MNINLNELDLNDVGIWPLPVKIVTIAVISLMILFLGYWTDTKKQLANLDKSEQEELTLRTTFEEKQHKAANLDAYKEQMANMKASFGALLRQLPVKTEVPGLIEDISHQPSPSLPVLNSLLLRSRRQRRYQEQRMSCSAVQIKQ